MRNHVGSKTKPPESCCTIPSVAVAISFNADEAGFSN